MRKTSLVETVQRELTPKIGKTKSVVFKSLQEGIYVPEHFPEAFIFADADKFDESVREACIANVLQDGLWGADGKVDFLIDGKSCFKMRSRREMEASPATCAKSWFDAFSDDAKLHKLYPEIIPGTRKIQEVLDETAMVISCSVDFGGNFCQLAYMVAMKVEDDGRAMLMIESVEHPEGKLIDKGGGQFLLSHSGVVFLPASGRPNRSLAIAGENLKVTSAGKLVEDGDQVAAAKSKLETSILRRLEAAEQLVRAPATSSSAESCWAGCTRVFSF